MGEAMLSSIRVGHRFFASVPVLLLALLASCDGSAPTDTFELSGIITVLLESEDAGGGIAGARVSFTSDTLLVSEATADETGRYRMRLATDHPFGQVRAEADGFQTQDATVFFDMPQRRIDLQLRRLPGGGG